MDAYGKTTTERLYLRKWHDGDKEAGRMPYEVIVITQVTRAGAPDPLTQETYTDPEGIARHNEMAEMAEKGHAP